jgi:hypothetical protein
MIAGRQKGFVYFNPAKQGLKGYLFLYLHETANTSPSPVSMIRRAEENSESKCSSAMN